MADFKKILLGTGAFVLAYFYGAITLHVIPPLIESIENGNAAAGVAGNNTLAGILWFGLIITWFIAFIIMPIALKTWGLTTKENEENPILGISIALAWAMFTLAISYFGWYWIEPLSNSLSTYTILQACFWIGLLLVWVSNVIVIPAYLIIEAKKTA